MEAVIDKNKCVWCGECANVCPVNAIKIDGDVAFVSDECIGCGTCIDVCTVKAITLK